MRETKSRDYPKCRRRLEVLWGRPVWWSERGGPQQQTVHVLGVFTEDGKRVIAEGGSWRTAEALARREYPVLLAGGLKPHGVSTLTMTITRTA